MADPEAEEQERQRLLFGGGDGGDQLTRGLLGEPVELDQLIDGERVEVGHIVDQPRIEELAHALVAEAADVHRAT